MKSVLVFLLLALMVLLGPFPAHARHDEDLRVGLFVNPPFVMYENGGYTGLAYDLWEKVAEGLGVKSHYVEYLSLDHLVHDAASGNLDIIVTNFTATYERADALLFSFPWYDGGLRIMVGSNSEGQVWEELKDNGHLYEYGGIFLFMLLLSTAITLVRRKLDSDYPQDWAYGLSASFHDLVAMAKRGRIETRGLGWFGNILAAFWMIFGVGVVAYVTSTITTTMTTASIKNSIDSVYDLPEKDVGVLDGSSEQEYLRRLGIVGIAYENIGEAIRDLADGELDAVVGDAPVLEYWVNSHPDMAVKVVGKLVHPEKYTFAANGSHVDLTQRISREILRLGEEDAIWKLRETYFGNDILLYSFE